MKQNTTTISRREKARRIKAELRERNPIENSFYDKNRACMKSWLWGAITGVPVAIGIMLLLFCRNWDTIPWSLFPLFYVASFLTMTTVFAMAYTADFGLSWLPNGLFRCVIGVLSIFDGMYVLIWVALALDALLLLAWVFGMLIFALLFPLETLLVNMVYKCKKNAFKRRIKSEYRLEIANENKNEGYDGYLNLCYVA